MGREVGLRIKKMVSAIPRADFGFPRAEKCIATEVFRRPFLTHTLARPVRLGAHRRAIRHVSRLFATTRRHLRAHRHHLAVGLQLDCHEAGAGALRPVRLRRTALSDGCSDLVCRFDAVGSIVASAAYTANDPDRPVSDGRFPGIGAVGAGQRWRRPRGNAGVHDAVLAVAARLAVPAWAAR